LYVKRILTQHMGLSGEGLVKKDATVREVAVMVHTAIRFDVIRFD